MRKISLWLSALVLCLCSVTTFTSCSKDDDPTSPVAPDPSKELTVEELAQQLRAIPGISDVSIHERKSDKRKVIFFNFAQQIDHKNPATGTFKQRCRITFRNENAVNVLQTEGYKTAETADELDIYSLTEELGGNQIDVEYRYFGQSLPEPFENVNFTYLYSEQASEDLHAVVNMLKDTKLLKGKWVSTGHSKGGITTALYAYNNSLKGYNDMDVYVPFCAPFIIGTHNYEVGDYLVYSCGKETGTNAKVTALMQAIIKEPLMSQLAPYVYANHEKYIAEMRQNGHPDSVISKILWESYLSLFWANMCAKYAYVTASILNLYIPDPEKHEAAQIDWFVRANDDVILKEYASLEQQETRGSTDQEIIGYRKENPNYPYSVQAMRELGYWDMKFQMLEGCDWITPKEMEKFSYEDHISNNTVSRYADEYDPTLMNSFLNDFLPNTTMKMVFIYGADDYWTGGAIPDPTNPNVTKIIVPGGIHSEAINNPVYYPETYRDMILNKVKTALNAF